MQPLFIMSSERSGSNLLRKMLGAHSTMAAPPPPHMWTHLGRMLPFFGPLTDDVNLKKLVTAAISMTNVEHSHLAWGYDIDAETILSEIPAHTLSGVIGTLYEDYTRRMGKSRWVCKENNLFDYALSIRATFPDARFIYLCRDGRDYACSIKKVPSHDQHTYYIAQEWRSEQMKSLSVYQDLLADEAALLVRYEDLIDDPEHWLRQICVLVELDYEPAMLAFHENESSQSDAQKTDYWQNLSRPVMSSNKGKFLKEMDSQDIGIFEAVAGDVLSVLGYPLMGQSVTIRRWHESWYYLQNSYELRRNRKALLEEPGRKERAAMLKNLQRIKSDAPEAYAPTIRYSGAHEDQ